MSTMQPAGTPIGGLSRQTGGTVQNAPAGLFGEVLVSELCGRYSRLAAEGRLFSAFALITSGVIYSTAAGTGGPLLWNGTSNMNAHLLGVLVGGVTTANTVATSIGLTGNGGQTAAPGSPTAIDASGNMLIGGPGPAMNVYRIGTVTNAGNRFVPLSAYGTGAINSLVSNPGWIDIGGSMIVPPYGWASVSFGNTATTGVIQLGLIWAEIPV